MIELALLAKKKSLSEAFKDRVDDLDTNGDGVISKKEIALASQDMLDAIRDVAQSNGEWNLVREIALIKGTYKAIDSNIAKGMAPGQGGRFAVMVDSLVDRGYSPEMAKAIAVKIGKAKYAWMR